MRACVRACEGMCVCVREREREREKEREREREYVCRDALVCFDFLAYQLV